MNYMNKCCHILTECYPVVSCGVLYDTEIRWNGGKLLECDRIVEQLLDNQIDFDYISCDYIIDAEMENENVKLGVQYELEKT